MSVKFIQTYLNEKHDKCPLCNSPMRGPYYCDDRDRCGFTITNNVYDKITNGVKFWIDNSYFVFTEVDNVIRVEQEFAKEEKYSLTVKINSVQELIQYCRTLQESECLL